MRKLTHAEILKRQTKKVNEHRLPFVVILNNIRSLYNVGSVFRTADGVGVEKLWLCGITGYPPHPQIAKTAIGAENQVTWEYHKQIEDVICEYKEKNYQIVLLEQMKESLPYDTFNPQFPVCLIVGNEIEGVSTDIISLCDAAVEIDMQGIKNSLNVSVAFGVIAYHFRSCYKRKGI